MIEEPYEDHWSESYDEPEPDEATVIPMLTTCPFCGHGPLRKPWNEGEPVRCKYCGAFIRVPGHA